MNIACKTRHFSRWAAKAGITNAALLMALQEMKQGLIDADLGGGIIKKRVAMQGKGKRGGARTLLATNKHDRWFYVYGFEKNEKENTTTKELDALKLLAGDLLRLSADQITKAISSGVLLEVKDEKSKV
jgi:hypothetical protein